MTTDEYDRLCRRLDELKQARDRAAGALAELTKRLKAEFGCATAEQATTLLKKLQAKEKRLGELVDAEHAAFLEKWGHVLK